MTLPRRLEGFGLRLRRVREDDAPFVHRLRTDPALARHLHPVEGGVAAQRAWIAARAGRADEAYYAIEALGAAHPCGLVRIAGLTPRSFGWGSWILDPDRKPPRAALASALLVYRAGFAAGAERAAFDVRRANWRTLAFHRRFGARRVGADGPDVLFELSRAAWERLAPRHAAALERAPA